MRRRRRRHRPGLWGYEAGQSGVGDIFGWFVEHGVPPRYRGAASAASTSSCTAARPPRQRVGEHGLVALDWHSGNRSVLVDHELSGVIVGQTLATRRRGHLPGAAGGDRVRHPRRSSRRSTRAGVPVTELDRRRRPAQERAADADLRRRDRPAAVGCIGSDAGPGARLGHPRRRRRRRLPGRPRGRRRDGHGRAGAVYRARPRQRRRLRRAVRASTRRCTTTSAAAPTTSCTGSPPRRRAAAKGRSRCPPDRRESSTPSPGCARPTVATCTAS